MLFECWQCSSDSLLYVSNGQVDSILSEANELQGHKESFSV